MRLAIITIMLLGMTFTQISANECVPVIGEPLTFGAVFSPGSLLLDDDGTAFVAVRAMTEAFNQCGAGSRPVEWQLESAATYDEAMAAVERFSDNDIPLIIGSGLDTISEALNDGAAEYGIVYWDVTERPRRQPSDWTFALRPDDKTLGKHTAQYIQSEVAHTVLDEPLRLALVVEETARAQAMADAIREQLDEAIVLDDNPRNSEGLAVQIREVDANVLLLLSVSRDANRLWLAMREADANVDAWLFLGQDPLTLSRWSIDDTDTTGVMMVESTHFAAESLGMSVPPEVYEIFLAAYGESSDETPDAEALSAATGTYHLLFTVLDTTTNGISSETIRSKLKSASNSISFNLRDGLPLVVRQQQEGGYCLLSPAPFATCTAPMQPFPTWRQRLLDNQS